MCSVVLLNHKPKLVRIIKLIAMMNVVVDVCVKIVGQSVVRDAIAWWQRRLVSWSAKAVELLKELLQELLLLFGRDSKLLLVIYCGSNFSNS